MAQKTECSKCEEKTVIPVKSLYQTEILDFDEKYTNLA